MQVTAKEAGWYEHALEGSRALAPLESSSALPVYEAAAEFVSPDLPVLDVGCGTGRFAELLYRRGHRGYLGIDFAPSVVAEAERYCPRASFEVGDIREWNHGYHHPDVCTYVLLEVLEHLDDDRDAINRIPPGCPVVFSVPNFWSESHVRRYAQPRDVFERFGDQLDFTGWVAVPFATPGRRIHVFRAERRASCL